MEHRHAAEAGRSRGHAGQAVAAGRGWQAHPQGLSLLLRRSLAGRRAARSARVGAAAAAAAAVVVARASPHERVPFVGAVALV